MYIYMYMGVSINEGTPKSSIFMGFPLINQPFWGTPMTVEIHMRASALHQDDPEDPFETEVLKAMEYAKNSEIYV